MKRCPPLPKGDLLPEAHQCSHASYDAKGRVIRECKNMTRDPSMYCWRHCYENLS